MSDSCNPVDCSLPGSSVHGIFQSRILEWVVMSFSSGSSLTSFYWLYFLLGKHPWEGRAPSETSCQLILRDRKVLLKNIVQSILLNVLTLWKDEFGSGSSVASGQDTAFLVAQTIKHLPAMRETWVRSLGWEGPLERKMAIHSSTLAWKIQWTEKRGGLQSMGSQRVGHDWATSLSLSLFIYWHLLRVYFLNNNQFILISQG